MAEKSINEKWAELLDFARQHATKQGLRTGIKWLEDSFNEYLTLSDATPGYNMGGQPGSLFNREVLAGKVILHFDGVGSGHVLGDEQLSRLKKSLDSIVQNENMSNQIKR